MVEAPDCGCPLPPEFKESNWWFRLDYSPHFARCSTCGTEAVMPQNWFSPPWIYVISDIGLSQRDPALSVDSISCSVSSHDWRAVNALIQQLKDRIS